MKIKELLKLCIEQIEKGNGEKDVLISDDDEGNGYHTLFYNIEDDIDVIRSCQSLFHDNNNPNDVVLLG